MKLSGMSGCGILPVSAKIPNTIVNMQENIADGMLRSWTFAIPLEIEQVSSIPKIIKEGNKGDERETEICNHCWLVELQACSANGVERPAKEEEPDFDVFE